MMRSIPRLTCALLLLNVVSVVASGCSDPGDGQEAPAATGTVSLPLQAASGDHLYRLSAVQLLIRPSYTWLSASNDPNETVLRASLPTGRHSAELQNWSLERADARGHYHAVDARLVSSANVEFTLFNATTTTISFQFETDGQIVSVGSGELEVAVQVTETTPACTPFGSDCAAETWCAPSELTGAPVACIPAGAVEVGAACDSPLDCGANSTCLRLRESSTCVELCPSEAFGTTCASGGVCEARGVDYGVCVAPRPEGECPLEPAFLPIPDRVDAVYDEKRCAVYVSASSGAVYRYDIWSRLTDVLLETGGTPRGIDLSPSGDRLLVADENGGAGPTNRMLLIDLLSGGWRELRFGKEFMEGGTYVPVFLDDRTALVTSTFLGSGWAPLRRVELESGNSEVLASLRQNSMLSPNADRSIVAFAESNISNGAFGRYDAATGGISHGETGWFAYEIAVNRDGTQYAVPSYGGVQLYNYDGGFVAAGSAGYEALGVAYSPVSDRLYVSWAGSTIEALDARTLNPLFTLDANPGLVWGGNFAFASGRLRISRDGERLLATVGGGVRLYPIPTP